ncbi:MAG: hemerythrin domain-containing protein [Candidatus Neomarinimicrobiota bacterium]
MKKYDYRAPMFQEFNIESEFYDSLSKKHIIRNLMEEHRVILNFCKQLKLLVKEIKSKNSIGDSQKVLKDLQLVSGHLLRTEKHHMREEQTLIRRLVRSGEFDPSQEIRRQHDSLGVSKRKLERTIYGIYTTSFDEFQKTLQSISNKLYKDLKKHIDLEENILYPQAIKLIPGKNSWKKIREESNNIGYCCFTPGKY